MTFRSAAAAATACTVLLAGCGSSGYYMVREPGSATPYYTTKYATSGSAVVFKDGRTGSAVTLQSSEVTKISKEEFGQGVMAPVPGQAGAGASAPAVILVPAAPQAKPQ